ncbi:hypothetical protein [Bosea sp. (in: a-proteobacteria)]|uniref:hypothetical protein n=1 Tax=Bosea sp. (in: a-proteobacteria) TaxID=1871050 RepID=UPI003F7054BF
MPILPNAEVESAQREYPLCADALAQLSQNCSLDKDVVSLLKYLRNGRNRTKWPLFGLWKNKHYPAPILKGRGMLRWQV